MQGVINYALKNIIQFHLFLNLISYAGTSKYIILCHYERTGNYKQHFIVFHIFFMSSLVILMAEKQNNHGSIIQKQSKK